MKHFTSSVQSTSHPLQLYLQRLPKGRPLFNQRSAKQLRNCLTNWVTGLPNPRLLGRGVSPQKLVYWLNCTLLKIRSLLSCYLLKIGVQYVLLRCTSCVLGKPHHAQIVKKELPALTHFPTGQSNFQNYIAMWNWGSFSFLPLVLTIFWKFHKLRGLAW